MAHLDDLVVISGLSGAGKSSAMNVFEDAGYFCVDNLPASMIRSLATLFMHEGSKVECACVVSDLRAGEYFDALDEVLRELQSDAVAARVLFLEADEHELLTRYRETRRRHPLSPNGNVADGIHREQALLAAIRERADTVIDTTGLSAAELRRKVASDMLGPGQPGKLSVTFGSFGHKHGPARDADLVLDVRFLPNPHWEPVLRPLTGFDRRVVQYVGRDGRLKEFYDRVLPLLEYLLPQYVAEGKAHLVVGAQEDQPVRDLVGAQRLDHPRELGEVGAAAEIADDRGALDLRPLVHEQPGERADHLGRQVVDAEVAGVLEHVHGRGLPGTRLPRDDHQIDEVRVRRRGAVAAHFRIIAHRPVRFRWAYSSRATFCGTPGTDSSASRGAASTASGEPKCLSSARLRAGPMPGSSSMIDSVIALSRRMR